MRLKLDESVPTSLALLMRPTAADLSTVAEQRMLGAPDTLVAQVCKDEERTLVTLDLDFANPMDYPPRQFRGLVVLRPGTRYSMELLNATARTLIRALADGRVPDRQLWIVQPDRIRVFDPEDQP